jgi:hypothetical protein
MGCALDRQDVVPVEVFEGDLELLSQFGLLDMATEAKDKGAIADALQALLLQAFLTYPDRSQLRLLERVRAQRYRSRHFLDRSPLPAR